MSKIVPAVWDVSFSRDPVLQSPGSSNDSSIPVMEWPEINPLSAISSGKTLNRQSSVLYVSEQSKDDVSIARTEACNLLDSGV
jgi:hypothetical protein